MHCSISLIALSHASLKGMRCLTSTDDTDSGLTFISAYERALLSSDPGTLEASAYAKSGRVSMTACVEVLRNSAMTPWEARSAASRCSAAQLLTAGPHL